MKREEILKSFCVKMGHKMGNPEIEQYIALCRKYDLHCASHDGTASYYGNFDNTWDLNAVPWGTVFLSVQEFKEFLEKGEEVQYKVGDRVVLPSELPSGWASGMSDYLGREVEIKFIKGEYFYFDGDDNWSFLLTEIAGHAENRKAESSPPESGKEIGKWYKDPYASEWMVNAVKVNGGKYEMHECYGFRANGMWTDSIEISLSGMIKATDDEVEKALINEAKKRGFKDGVEFDSVKGVGVSTKGYQTTVGATGVMYDRDGFLYAGGGYIFNNGEWATIISEPKEAVKNKTLEDLNEALSSSPQKKEKEMVLAKGTIVHCPTEELSDKVLKMAFKFDKMSAFKRCNDWKSYKEKTCYNLNYNCFADLSYYKSEGTNVISAEQFLRDNGEFTFMGSPYSAQAGIYAGHMHQGIILGDSSTGNRHSISMHAGTLYNNMAPITFKQEYPNTFEQSSKPNGKVELPTKKSKKKELNLSVKSDVKKINL